MTSRNLLMPLICLALAACSAEEAPEFCLNHAQFHAEHVATNATLSVTMAAEGDIISEVSLPISTFGEQSAITVLQDPSKVYALQTAADCKTADTDVQSLEDAIVAVYSSECGADNKLGQIDVLLFESLPELNEVEVSVITPATQKHFAINRQCASALFRFE